MCDMLCDVCVYVCMYVCMLCKNVRDVYILCVSVIYVCIVCMHVCMNVMHVCMQMCVVFLCMLRHVRMCVSFVCKYVLYSGNVAMYLCMLRCAWLFMYVCMSY